MTSSQTGSNAKYYKLGDISYGTMCAALCAALETVTMVIVHQDTIQVKNAHIKLLQYIPAIM